MKKDLYEILDTLTPEELDTLPEELFQAEELDDMTLQRISDAVAEKNGLVFTSTNDKCSGFTTPSGDIGNRKSKTVKPLWRILAVAACSALLVGIGAGAYAYAAARKEYKNALTFFYENDLSTEGLTKNEIKEVYRDFYSHSFTNKLTTDVLLNSRPDVIRGYEITGDDSEWDTTVPDTSISDYKTPVYYEYRHIYNQTEGQKKYSPDESIFEKYKNGEKVWEVSFRDITIYDYYGDTENDTEPVIVYGTGTSPTNPNDEIVTLIALDAEGTILWETVQNNTPGSEQIDAILSNPDGSYTAFGRCAADNKQTDNCLCINKYSKNGAPISANTINIRDHFIKNVALTSSGYLVQISSYTVTDISRVLKLDFEGNLVGDFSYESDEYDFYIADFCEYKDTVYISGYSTPKAPKKVVAYGQRDIFMLKMELADGVVRSDEELLSMFRDNFTAVLLVCEPDSGTPKEFYSVAGSLGDEVYATGDSVCWFTKDIIDSSYSADVDFDGLGVTTTNPKSAVLCRFYANTFNPDGTFKEQKKLDLMTEIRWGK